MRFEESEKIYDPSECVLSLKQDKHKRSSKKVTFRLIKLKAKS